MLGRLDEAQTNYLAALELKPDYVNAEVNAAGILSFHRQYDEALIHYQRALSLAPEYARAHHLFGVLLGRMGNLREASRQFQLAVHYFDRPEATAWNDLAWTLAVVQDPEIHNPAEAVRLAKEACSLTKYSDAAVLDTLAVSYAEAGDYAEAIAMTDKAIDILTQQQRPQVVTEMQRREQLYIQHKTYHPAVVTEERPLKSMLDLTPRN